MKSWIILLFISAACLGWAGSSEEGVGSATRGKFLAGRGVIVPPEEISLETYIAKIDYRYPIPENTAGRPFIASQRKGVQALLTAFESAAQVIVPKNREVRALL